jgi:peptidoglycan-associated lipoprotein
MTTTRSAVIVLAIAAILAVGTVGCSSKAKTQSTPESTPTTAETTPKAPPVETPSTPAEPFPQQPVDKTAVVEPTVDELNRQGVLKTIHFAYNSNDLDDAAKAILQANADWLRSHSGYSVEVGGHCDERGSIG